MGDIRLTNSEKLVRVDDSDFNEVNKHRWFLDKYGAVVGNRIVLSRFLLNPESRSVVDHINRDKLDNRRCNLRICSQRQNTMNQAKHAKAASKYKGVHAHKGKWRARIVPNGKNIHLGLFDHEKDAALAYNVAAQRHYGEYAKLNEVQSSQT